jgi:hypothetical protein
MKRKFLQQEIDDYQKDMGPYDALAEVFNKTLESAKAGTTYVYQTGGGSYLTDGASGDGLKMKTSHDYQSGTGGLGAVQTTGGPVVTGWNRTSVRVGGRGGGTRIVETPIYANAGPGQIGVVGQEGHDSESGSGYAPRTPGAVLPLFPTAPNAADYSNGAPEFTRGQERTLKGEQTFTEMDRSSKGLLDRIKGQDEWRPYADSGLGLLQKVMQGKV